MSESIESFARETNAKIGELSGRVYRLESRIRDAEVFLEFVKENTGSEEVRRTVVRTLENLKG